MVSTIESADLKRPLICSALLSPWENLHGKDFTQINRSHRYRRLFNRHNLNVSFNYALNMKKILFMPQRLAQSQDPHIDLAVCARRMVAALVYKGTHIHKYVVASKGSFTAN